MCGQNAPPPIKKSFGKSPVTVANSQRAKLQESSITYDRAHENRHADTIAHHCNNALHACDAAYLYVIHSFIWNQLNEQDRNIRTKGVSVSYRLLLVLRGLPFSTKPNETERLLSSNALQNVSNSNISIPLFHT